MATYSIELQAADGSTVRMGGGDASRIETAGGVRMSPVEIKAVLDAGGAVSVKLFDNDAGLPVLTVAEEA